MKKITLLAIVLTCSFWSCKPTEILPGFKLYDAPNAVDKPGRIYRLSNDNKTDYLVEYLPINPQSSSIVIPEKEKTKTMKIGTMLSFISNNSVVNANGELNSNKVSNFNFKLKDAQIYKISDADLRPHYAEMKKRITDDIKLFGLQSPRYFIVRESVTATEIFIQTTKDVKNDASLKAEIDRIIGADANINWTSGRKDEIKVTLKDGLFVFYKPEEISLQTSAAGDVEISIKPAKPVDIEKLQIGTK
ncbi:hypothetical protein Aoki45_12610 [Algoriphagus sp. oki45]|uniref:hypothetical protein n=1 Tax=Algoriphagus sp. oki45 TaxID=3067294 RepID=UPI0027EC586E|nr:hypothetical protein Aoki45_12610 [Algoriphagus sp. oki45]